MIAFTLIAACVVLALVAGQLAWSTSNWVWIPILAAAAACGVAAVALAVIALADRGWGIPVIRPASGCNGQANGSGC